MSDLLLLFSQFGQLVSWVGSIFSYVIFNIAALMSPLTTVINLLPEFVRQFLLGAFVIEFVYLILGR